jgi:hypothetical protein
MVEKFTLKVFIDPTIAVSSSPTARSGIARSLLALSCGKYLQTSIVSDSSHCTGACLVLWILHFPNLLNKNYKNNPDIIYKAEIYLYLIIVVISPI